MSEQYPVDQFLPLLESRLAEIKSDVAKLSRNLKSAPAGRLRIVRHKGAFQYYFIESKDDLAGRYLKRSEDPRAKSIVQRDYEKDALKELLRQQKCMEAFLKGYSQNQLNAIYEELHPGRKPLVSPLQTPDAAYIEQWLSQEYKGKPFSAETPILRTSRGERVRSKSELIIADALTRMNVPYLYEKPLKLKGIGKIYPDFTCLNVRRRTEFVWEHFGMMDDLEYANKAMRKERCYEENGFFCGVNLIITRETQESPLDVTTVTNLIRCFLQ